jgi:hypothetical protein
MNTICEKIAELFGGILLLDFVYGEYKRYWAIR